MDHANLDVSINLADLESGPALQKPPLAKPLAQTSPLPAKSAGDKKPTSACSILTIDYWREYFDVTEQEILTKVKACINPMASGFEQLIENKVDLYGPFWISTTLIFAMIVAPRIWSVLLFSAKFDISKIGFSFTLIYGCAAAFTAVMYFLCKFMGAPVPIFKTLAIYGYAYSGFLLAAFGTVLSLGFIKFILAFGAGAHSILFLLRNFKPDVEKLDSTNKIIVLLFVIGMQLFVTLMIYFNYFR